MHSWMLYGYGTSATRILEVRKASGGSMPILAGRDAAKVTALAQRFGLVHRVVALDDSAALQKALDGVALVLHTAGPYAETCAPMLRACLAARVHYLDITGEVQVFAHCHAHNEQALTSGIVVLPGVGFDVVPSDCLAGLLQQRMPDATLLELSVLQTGTKPSVGTIRSTVRGMAGDNYVWQQGVLTRKAFGHQNRVVTFRSAKKRAFSIPMGDIMSAHYSTGIANVVFYGVLSPVGIRVGRILGPLLRNAAALGFAEKIVSRFTPKRPTQVALTEDEPNVPAEVWGRVQNERGESVEGHVVLPPSRLVTARAALASVDGVLLGEVAPGYRTPSQAFGTEFIHRFGDVFVAGQRVGPTG